MMRRLSMTGIGMMLAAVLVLAACGTPLDINQPAGDEGGNSEEAQNADGAGQDPSGGADEQDAQPSDVVHMPPEALPLEIPTEDGRMLEGLYYPAAVENAPVVVLMHWAPGDMMDWAAIAPWLQNRLDELDVPAGNAPFLDLSWFPPIPEEISFGVVVFNFGKYGASEYGGSRQSYVADGVAALNFVAQLAEVDPDRIAAIGASIGADGAVDACYQFNAAGGAGSCIGALSLSPGNYLTEAFTYPEAAAELDAAGYPVWCLGAEKDGASPGLCRALSGSHTQGFIFEGGAHGMDLLTTDQVFIDPPLTDFNTMQVLQEFLEVTFGVPLNDFTIP